MADSAARVGGRKRGASPLPPPPAPLQPAPERAPSTVPEDDDDVARPRASIMALEATSVSQATELLPPAAHAGRVLAAARALDGSRCNVTSAASPAMFLAVLARLAENGYATELVRCVNICKDARSNAQLWERIVDLPHMHRGAAHNPNYARTRLNHWAREGDLARVRETLGRGARTNATTSSGFTALHGACSSGHLAVVCELLDHGADIEAHEPSGGTPLLFAAGGGHGDMVLELVARGADVNAVGVGGWTALIAASFFDRAASTAILLLQGADVNAQDDEGNAALMYAAANGIRRIVRLLLAAPGIDVHLPNMFGSSALSLARAKGHADVVALLEAAGAR